MIHALPLVSFTVALLLLLPASGQAVTYRWEMDATEDQVNNAGGGDGSTDSLATGHVDISYEAATGVISYTVEWNGLQGLLSAIHLHGPATPSESVMPHLWNVFDGPDDVLAAGVSLQTGSYSGSDLLIDLVTGTPQLMAPINLQHMIDELGYMNIHSTTWPFGEIRANLILEEENVPVTGEHRTCIDKMQKQLFKIATAVERRVYNCIRLNAGGLILDSIESCITTEDPKTTAAMNGANNAFDGACSGFGTGGYLRFPAFGTAQVDELRTAAEARDADLTHAMLGPDLDAGVIDDDTDRDASRCQQDVIRKAQKCESTMLKEFRKCSKLGFKGTSGPGAADIPFDDETDQALCLDYDPSGKIAKKCDVSSGKIDPIRKSIAKRCVNDGVDLNTAFPGCATGDAETLHGCVLAAARCSTCTMLKAASEDLPADCDSHDDGVHNSSCS